MAAASHLSEGVVETNVGTLHDRIGLAKILRQTVEV